jgi:stalled ribosome rescue protein Dom34
MANHKQFGVWLDKENATIVGRENVETGNFTILAHLHGEHTAPNSNEKNAHNQEKMLQEKFFKEITAHMQNADIVHTTGNGQVQEQFNHHLAETPQFKNTVTSDSTSDKMSDKKLIAFFSEKFN